MKRSLTTALFVLLTLVAALMGCESGGGDTGGGDGVDEGDGNNSGGNATVQAACDNYCKLCESGNLPDCMEDCLGDEDAPNLTQECLECTANATECGEINNKCWSFCKWNPHDKAICDNYCQLCDENKEGSEEGQNQLQFCMGNCSEWVGETPQTCQECLASTHACKEGEYKYECGDLCD